MICATTECPIFHSCHQSADCCYFCCWCTACCVHNWFCFYSFTLQLVKCCYCHYCFHWLLPPLVVGPTIGSAFARTTFLPRQLRCDLTDLVSTWHFLPLLLLFMNFWDQLMMKELRSIFGLNFAFYFSRSFISSENPACNWWWGIKPRESRSRFGPKLTVLPPLFQVISWWGRNQCFFSWSSSPTVCICWTCWQVFRWQLWTNLTWISCRFHLFYIANLWSNQDP